MKKLVITLIILLISKMVYCQVSGNQVFSENDNRYRDFRENINKQIKVNKLYLNDSSFIVEANILKNVKADNYVAVFGLNQEAGSVKNCNNKINDRIKRFIANIKKLGIKDSDIYTDLLTQYRVYDFNKFDNQYSEYIKGFELSKNIIIRYTKPGQIEQFITAAAEDSIFDLVKVDYIIKDISKIYDELFVVAKGVIQKKKQRYTELTNAKLLPASQIYGENFASYYPQNSYKSYNAFAQNYYENYSWIRENEIKRLHKFQTYYFDNINYSGFDKIINPVILEPVIEVVLTVQVKFEIQK